MGRRVVKNLYVDDDTGVLIADCEGGSAVIGVVLNGNGMIPANRVDIRMEVLNTLPPAGPDWLGRMVRCQTGVDDQVCVCIQGEDGFRWRQFRLNK